MDYDQYQADATKKKEIQDIESQMSQMGGPGDNWGGEGEAAFKRLQERHRQLVEGYTPTNAPAATPAAAPAVQAPATIADIMAKPPEQMTPQELQAATKASQDLLRAKQLVGTARSYGDDATDTLNKMQTAASPLAADTAQKTGTLATTGAIRGARTAGLSKAQAAQTAASQTGGTVMGSYLQDLQNQKANYLRSAESMQQGALGLGSLASQEKQLELQKYGIDTSADIQRAQLGQQQKQYEDQQAWNKANSFLVGIGALLGGAGSLVKSDERVKHDVSTGYGMLDEVVSRVKPHLFKYNQEHEMGEPETERLGIMAQDLEETPLDYMVTPDEEGVKRVDTGQLTLANTAMISELSDKLDRALSYIKKGGR